MQSKLDIAAMDARSKLSAAKLDLLRMRLSGRGAENAVGARIAHRPAGENPVSFGQERILFQLLLEPDATLFHIPLLVKFDGALDRGALEAGLNEMIRRHEVLRSSYAQWSGVWRQSIAPQAELAFARIDLRHLSEPERETELSALVAAEARKPFDLAKPPLMRATLAALGPNRHALLLTIHHIVWDGWSSVLMIREITALYKSFLSGGGSPLAPLPVQYADFAHWQRRLVDSEIGKGQIAYWRRQLASLPQYSTLPTDRPRSAAQRRRGASHSFSLAPEAQARLSELARRANTTLFVTLLSGFFAFLFQVTGQSDFAVGTTIAYRTRQELEKLVGFFTNVLVLRADMAGGPSFETLLARVHEIAVDAQANQDAPFERIVEELAPKRDLGHNPLFQIAFVLHNLPAERLELPGVAMTVAETDAAAAAFDLVLHVFEEPDRLKARFEYDADLFDRSTIARLASNFESYLGNLLDDPAQPIGCVSRLTKAEEGRILAAAQSGLATVAPRAILHDLVDASAKGDAAAVVCDAERLSYAELGARANQLAHRLMGLGVGPDVAVGVFVEPSIQAIVAILGVLKAGGAYVPIDPSYPAARIDFMMEDCRAAAIVSMRTSAAALPSLSAPIVLLDDDEILDQMPQLEPESSVGPDNLAYIVYTSGSTGQPKGVMVSHRNAVASTLARRHYYREPVGAFLLLSSIAFDSSVAGLFWTLADGGILCIPDERTRRDPLALLRLIERHSISHLLALPSMYFALLELSAIRSCASLRSVIVAGEECKAEVALRHFQQLPQVRLHNEYGPSETTVWASADTLSAPGSHTVPIGQPIPGAQIYCVGPNGDLAPTGTPGELWLGGEGVARGYRNAPDLTAERFIPNPFAGSGARLFKSGDMGRVDADGRIEFLGRIDDLVKISGYRVEPREIEAALLRDSAVMEAVVVARVDRRGSPRLVAFAVLAKDTQNLEGDLKGRLSQTLPAYMVPERVVVVPSLPRLPNGKISRAALSEFETEPPAKLQDGGPLDDIELLFAEIWQDVLGVDRVEASDNFFDIGGASLSAIQVIARVQQLFEAEIPVTILFDAASLAEFSREVVRIAGDKTLPSEEFDALLRPNETESVQMARSGGFDV
ncbi:non-ribosomal peptide synthetase [Methylocystis heyeri]|uniref:Amino acid adenylation domain-containing protein n=1 Tax=Methylocystis heyeri TaxID=391905 RepID=A0A6B8KGC6_9HYPH|nr:non-ribosomal peptide synthetase [Methylocystis heyeri]QGM46682.1 amino acid adenylation domain-containing protein [Methylocystis heyeri]